MCKLEVVYQLLLVPLICKAKCRLRIMETDVISATLDMQDFDIERLSMMTICTSRLVRLMLWHEHEANTKVCASLQLSPPVLKQQQVCRSVYCNTVCIVAVNEAGVHDGLLFDDWYCRNLTAVTEACS